MTMSAIDVSNCSCAVQGSSARVRFGFSTHPCDVLSLTEIIGVRVHPGLSLNMSVGLSYLTDFELFGGKPPPQYLPFGGIKNLKPSFSSHVLEQDMGMHDFRHPSWNLPRIDRDSLTLSCYLGLTFVYRVDLTPTRSDAKGCRLFYV